MKKFYTLTLALLSFGVMSATGFTVNHGGNAVKEGETILVTDTHNTTIPGLGTKYEFNADLSFVGESDGNVTVGGTLVSLQDTSGAMAFSLCPSVCTYVENGVITNTFAYEAANGTKDLQLHLGTSGFSQIEQPVVYGELDMTVGYVNDSQVLTFKLVVTNDPNASIANIANGAGTVSFVNNVLTLNLAKAASLEVFSATGSRAKFVKNVTNQSVDLSELPTGIYIYRVANKTGKIIIRK